MRSIRQILKFTLTKEQYSSTVRDVMSTAERTQPHWSLVGWIGVRWPADPTSIGLLASELQPRVGRRCADESEGEVVGVLPGHLSGQRAVLSSLGREGEDSVSEG